MSWTRRSNRGNNNTYRILVRKPLGNQPLSLSIRTWEDDIRMWTLILRDVTMDLIGSLLPAIGSCETVSTACCVCVLLTVWNPITKRATTGTPASALAAFLRVPNLISRVERVRNSVKSRNYLPRDLARSVNCTRRMRCCTYLIMQRLCSNRASPSTESPEHLHMRFPRSFRTKVMLRYFFS